MRLEPDSCRDRLEASRFAVLGTTNGDGTPHLVPVVFAVEDSDVLIPVDTVKAKRSTRLRRITNLERTRAAALLVDHRSEDWSDLWWVRADLGFVGMEPAEVAGPLRAKYAPYEDEASIAQVLRLRIHRLTGWVAGEADRRSAES